MNIQLLKTAKTIAVAGVILLFSGCSKNTIILEYGGDDDNTGSGSNGKTTLVTFNASIEGRNLLTKAMSPMEKGIQNRLFAFRLPDSNTKEAPAAEGLYITSSPGILIGTDGYKMYLDNGIYNFYAVSDNFSTIPPVFTNGQSEPLFNGIDYLWWHNTQQDVTSTQIQIPIVYLHAATQVVFEISGGDSIKIDKLLSATITPPEPGASMELATGTIPATGVYGKADKMGINGLLCQYIMLPLETTVPMTLTLELLINGESAPHEYTANVFVPDGALEAGNSYLFSAVIDGLSITFPSVSIKHWTDVDETGKPVYPTVRNE